MSKRYKAKPTKQHKRQKASSQKFFLVVCLFFIFLIGYIAFISQRNTTIAQFVARSKELAHKAKSSVIPTITSIPTATPTPAPVYTGYCVTVPVLMYHHIQPQAEAVEKKQTALSVDNGTFDGHMAYIIGQGYTPITAKQLVDSLKTKTPLSGKSIVVTIDDGYKDNFVYAYPVLQKYRIPTSIMLSTGLMGGDDYLSWGQVEEMGRSGLVSYTNHTWSHYAIAYGANSKITEEITTAKQQLEAHGFSSSIFTYPYGSFNDNAIRILQQHGFDSGFSTMPGTVQCDSFIMTLHRSRIGNGPLSSYGI